MLPKQEIYWRKKIMAKRKIDNLSETATASELEQAILEVTQPETNQQVSEPVVEEKTETPAEKVEPVKEVETKVEAPKEITEPDVFGGDYSKAVKSYKEAQSWNTRMSQDVALMKKELEALKAPKVQETKTAATMTQEQFNEWYERDPLSANRYVANLDMEEKLKTVNAKIAQYEQERTQSMAQSVVTQFRTQYEDFKTLEPEIREVVERMPEQITDNPKYYDQALDMAYWSVKGRKIKEAEERAREAGRREAVTKAQVKKDAFVEGSSKTANEQPLDVAKMNSEELFSLMKSRGVA